ncbi:hypothetical protein [Fischerella thermalis]|uniref:hypothetical protein n=1 Tax=Fischerella thermalis TaxID=372787 RepID=UPI0011AEFA25|nr:hypothetical protein [Fischerella thermalis]
MTQLLVAWVLLFFYTTLSISFAFCSLTFPHVRLLGVSWYEVESHETFEIVEIAPYVNNCS